MESYIEVTFITSFLSIIFSLIISMYLSQKVLSFKKICLYSITVSLFNTLYFGKYFILFLLIIEMIFIFKIFRYSKVCYGMMMGIRVMLLITYKVFLKGGIHGLTYFIYIYEYKIFIVWFILVLLILMILKKGKYFLFPQKFIYEVILFLNNEKIHLTGYYDSGNFLSYHHIPVIFISKAYEKYMFEPIFIETETVNGKGTHVVNEGLIQMEGYEKMKVYVAVMEKFPPYCNCLLNIFLFMR